MVSLRPAGADREREDALDRALAVGARAQDRGPPVILEGAGQDLAGAGAVVIDQDVQRHSPPGPAVGRQGLGLSLGSPSGRDDQARVDEPLGDLDGDVEQAARDCPGGRAPAPSFPGRTSVPTALSISSAEVFWKPVSWR